MHPGNSPTEPVLSWRVNPSLPLAKLAGAAVLAGLGLFVARSQPTQWTLALLAAAVLLGWAARDVLVPVRLAGDPTGVTVVAGFARRERLAWEQIERVRVDRRQRLGLGTELLEIDAGHTLHLFSANDLGAPPHEVAEALAGLRAAG
ncbi:MAG TPA: PH domain-containing protein [Catenuloplanes sp.]|jgi:hypothetical protein